MLHECLEEILCSQNECELSSPGGTAWQLGLPLALAGICCQAGEKAPDAARPEQQDDAQKQKERRPVVAIPYLHNISHRLKGIGRKAGVNVVMTAPNKLKSLCRRVNSDPTKKKQGCTIKHRTPFVECTEGLVYSLPVTCGKQYIGQTGRCMNERLLEHKNNFEQACRNLGIHCRDCPSTSCAPVFQKCKALANHKDQLVREIIEAASIASLRDDCVSTPSVALTKKEFDMLKM